MYKIAYWQSKLNYYLENLPIKGSNFQALLGCLIYKSLAIIRVHFAIRNHRSHRLMIKNARGFSKGNLFRFLDMNLISATISVTLSKFLKLSSLQFYSLCNNYINKISLTLVIED